MLQIYCGNGKGKTSAAIGAAIRASGAGMKVLFAQFLKNGDSSECKILNKIDCITTSVSDKSYLLFENTQGSSTELRDAYTKLLKEIIDTASAYQMLILDEALDALEFGYIDSNTLISFLKKHKSSCEIILTGRRYTSDLEIIADYISEINSVKHPFYSGTPARRGIEF